MKSDSFRFQLYRASFCLPIISRGIGQPTACLQPCSVRFPRELRVVASPGRPAAFILFPHRQLNSFIYGRRA